MTFQKKLRKYLRFLVCAFHKEPIKLYWFSIYISSFLAPFVSLKQAIVHYLINHNIYGTKFDSLSDKLFKDFF